MEPYSSIGRIRLKHEHPRAHDSLHGFRPLFLPSQTLDFLG